MAAVVKAKPKNAPPTDKSEPYMEAAAATHMTAPLLSNTDERADIVVADTETQYTMQVNRNKTHSVETNETLSNTVASLSEDMDDGPVIGIITLEDVFEELLQVRCNRINCSSF